MEGDGDGKTGSEAVGNEAFAFDEEQGFVFAFANEARGFDVVVAVAATAADGVIVRPNVVNEDDEEVECISPINFFLKKRKKIRIKI